MSTLSSLTPRDICRAYAAFDKGMSLEESLHGRGPTALLGQVKDWFLKLISGGNYRSASEQIEDAAPEIFKAILSAQKND